MRGTQGQITVRYDGQIPDALLEYFWAIGGVRVTAIRPLVIETGDPEDLLNRIYRLVGDSTMKTRYIELRPARSTYRNSAACAGV